MSRISTTAKLFDVDEVSRHNTAEDLYIVIHDHVYDVTNFVDEHPGGTDVLLELGGQDATEAFEEINHSRDAKELLNSLQVGTQQQKQILSKGNGKGGLSVKPQIHQTGWKLSYLYRRLIVAAAGVGVAAWLLYMVAF